MTWSLQNTISWSSETSLSDHNTAWAYFFDTFMNGVSTWYVTAWTGTQPDYRKFKITLNNKYNNNAPYSMYFSVQFGGTDYSNTYTGLKIIIDARYTSQPQDRYDLSDFTATSAPFDACGLFGYAQAGGSPGVLDYPDAASTGSGPYKFWTSTENNDARLVTKGRRVVFYWPGWTSGYFYEDSNWDGTYNNNGQHVFGITYSNGARIMDPGVTSYIYNNVTDGSGVLFSKPNTHLGENLLYNISTNAGGLARQIFRQQTRADTPVTPEIDYSTTQKDLLVQGFAVGGAEETTPTFDAITENDVGVFSPHSKATNINWFGNEQGEVVRVNGGDYWLLAASDTVTESVMFNFGATQPSFS